MANTMVTTGADVVHETRKFNEEYAKALQGQPRLDEMDVADVRAMARRSAPPQLSHARVRTIQGRAGEVPVRILAPDRVDGVVLHFHGGGWVAGAADDRDPQLWELAETARVAVVSVDYRLAPEHPFPAAVDDAEDAARWLTEHALEEFGTDRLAVAGESAGAYLAVVALLRLGDQARGFCAAQLTYGCGYDLSLTPSARAGAAKLFIPTPTLRWFVDCFTPGLPPEARRAPELSPLYADLRDLPPARFVVGAEDPLLDDTLFLEARWRAAGNATELEIVADAVHGFARFPLTVAERERARQARFIRRAVTSRRESH
ncbi:alpha/beta hydrolase [Actinomadura rupiterrae]|uniref:alpha/beta hydrolase n=1 Tax=Actinomadura rupiterrae TaxID=559627 RepID=UPI0020A5B562|nr:alpha/beta hydrolase [Actinomadura rupiterrae]MCP2342294.1 acetyl esterase/lipase [Actinomadura rupiterrae]